MPSSHRRWFAVVSGWALKSESIIIFRLVAMARENTAQNSYDLTDFLRFSSSEAPRTFSGRQRGSIRDSQDGVASAMTTILHHWHGESLVFWEWCYSSTAHVFWFSYDLTGFLRNSYDLACENDSTKNREFGEIFLSTRSFHIEINVVKFIVGLVT